MKKTGIVFALFAIVLTTGAGARAQRPSLKTSLVTQGPVTQAPDLSKLNIDKILQQLQTTKVQPSSEQLGVMLSSGGNPAQVGTVVIQIHALQQQMAQAQQAFLTQFIATLVPEQLQRLQAVQIAVQLQPILPVFQSIFLF